jgi:cytochrome c
MKGAGADRGSTKMLRSARIHIALVILIALAASSLARVHVAGGAELAAAIGLAEAWCRPCHAIEPQMPSSFEAIANRHGTTALSLKVFLKTSHQNMPNLVLAPDQADALASYILSLKTN